jgi:hypothetical protein
MPARCQNPGKWGARRFGDDLELRAHRLDGQLLQFLVGWQGRLARHGSPGQLPQVRSDGRAFQPVGFYPLFEIGSHAQPRVVSQRSQLERQRQDGLHIAPRANRRQQYSHSTSNIILTDLA